MLKGKARQVMSDKNSALPGIVRKGLKTKKISTKFYITD
jgi:hypothetical protein